MSGLLPNVDPNGLLEYSVVYTDRALNHMSQQFQDVMRDISDTLKEVYRAQAVALVPGSGTYGMEAVARQIAKGKKCLVIRNGWFSYRWTQILEKGCIADGHEVMKAQLVSKEGTQNAFRPAPIEEVVAKIKSDKPDVVFAPHVETAAGMIIPDDYITAIGNAVHSVGGVFVLDCIASGTIWVDMEACGVDFLISAPQKGWSGSPCCGIVMMSKKGLYLVQNTESDSFACDLGKWLQIMQAYENGGHAYHATMPTDGIRTFWKVMHETKAFGFENARNKQNELGTRIRTLLEENGFASVAAPLFKAPGVVVSYTTDPMIKNGSKFKEAGVQIAGGVPLMCDEPDDFQTFRIGLFGLDKLKDVDGAVARFAEVLKSIE